MAPRGRLPVQAQALGENCGLTEAASPGGRAGIHGIPHMEAKCFYIFYMNYLNQLLCPNQPHFLDGNTVTQRNGN